LPEGLAREVIERSLRVSPGNDFALLAAIGGDCAGAVAFLPPGSKPPAAGERRLTDAELAALLADLPRHPPVPGGERARLSLTGAQHKLPVVRDAGGWALPLDRPSTHIAKVAIRGFDGSVANEALCLATLARLGIEAAPAAPLRLGDVEVLMVERYDRLTVEGVTTRVHQEDACQALGVVPSRKYEREGGPGHADLVRLIRRSSTRAGADTLQLLDLIFANLLLGNADAHGKNVALLRGADGPRLAPAYDIVCTAAYEGLDDRMAMRIGGEYRPAGLRERHWRRLAEEIGVGHRRLMARARRLSGWTRRSPRRETRRGGGPPTRPPRPPAASFACVERIPRFRVDQNVCRVRHGHACPVCSVAGHLRLLRDRDCRCRSLLHSQTPLLVHLRPMAARRLRPPCSNRNIMSRSAA
jgi:serine/threonine-protein kinase HipA